jgi:hypothetical protein
MELEHVAPESDTQFQEQNIVSESEGLQDLSDDCDAAVATDTVYTYICQFNRY